MEPAEWVLRRDYIIFLLQKNSVVLQYAPKEQKKRQQNVISDRNENEIIVVTKDFHTKYQFVMQVFHRTLFSSVLTFQMEWGLHRKNWRSFNPKLFQISNKNEIILVTKAFHRKYLFVMQVFHRTLFSSVLTFQMECGLISFSQESIHGLLQSYSMKELEGPWFKTGEESSTN